MTETDINTQRVGANACDVDSKLPNQAVDLETVTGAANLIQLIWIPAVCTLVVLVAAISQMNPLLFIAAGLGGVVTFLGWCFAQSL